jgi:hypothetical protein
MNEFPNQTSRRHARASIRHGRHPRHLHRLHRLSHGFGDGHDAGCRERRGQTSGHRSGPDGTGRPGGYARRGRPDHPGRGRNRRAVHELHTALAGIAGTGDEQLRDEAAQVVTEAITRLNGLLAADR